MSDTSLAAPEQVAPALSDTEKTVDPAATALVKKWVDRVKAAKTHPKIEKAFKEMRRCMEIAAEGTDVAEWLDKENYTVPIINRHINQAVATLYARNPRAIAKRKQKLMYKIWDGDIASLQAAVQSIAMSQAQPQMADPATGMPVQPQVDQQALALVQEVQEVKKQLVMYDRLGRTMQLLFAYYLDEQDAGYREQIKAMVRRAKVCGVAYAKLGFQRQLKKDPDIEARIADVTDQIARVETLAAQMAAGEIETETAKAGELKYLLADLQSKVEVIVREGPVLSFPRATEIIVDPRCRHLKTFSGARWLAHEFDLTPDEVQESYGVELKKGEFTAYTESGQSRQEGAPAAKDGEVVCARVWEVQDKANQEVFVVCDGYCDFLKAPAEPDVKIERFWTIFPLVFNEVESEKRLFPPSDVWNARFMQREYNSSRQGLAEHRIASRPKYGTPAGKLEDKDKEKLSTGAAHEIIELAGMRPEDDIGKVLQRVPTAAIDPNLYETESTFRDVQRTVGSQEANLGGTSGATATESSIAENSRMSASADNTDDLDSLLTALARSMGQLMLLELDIQTVMEVCGPGAVWPQVRPRREEIVKDLFLEIEAGSSGRPNKAAELANLERAMPFVQLIPGINPAPLAKKYVDLLDLDPEETVAEGMPSIAALNQMASKPVMASDPNAQGSQGADNSARPAGNEPGSQPAFPAPAPGVTPAAA